MPASQIAELKRKAREKIFDPEPLMARLRELMKNHNESYRESSLRSGLDEQAVRRILAGQRPNITSCVLMANHFGIDPNEFITLAGWPEIDVFKVKTVSADALPPEAVEVAMEIAKIADSGLRRQVADAIKLLLSKHFDL
jgi:transcriptional regulator with XRE-family HTH domain